MKIRCLILLMALVVGTFNSMAQSLIGSAGKVTGRFSYSVGEIAIDPIADSSNLITVGFHQPNLWAVSLVENPSIGARVYPNPTINSINIEIIGELIENYMFGLFSLDGKMIFSGSIHDPVTNINLELLPSGQYNLLIYNSGNVVAKFKIVKVQ